MSPGFNAEELAVMVEAIEMDPPLGESERSTLHVPLHFGSVGRADSNDLVECIGIGWMDA